MKSYLLTYGFSQIIHLKYCKSYIYIFIICSSSKLLFAQTLCEQFGSLTPDRTFNGLYTNQISCIGLVIYISGDCIFNNRTYFENCKIRVKAGAKIKLTADPSLGPIGILSSTAIFNNCKIFSSNCNDLWSGFIVYYGKRLELVQSTYIEDAIIAVDAFNGTILDFSEAHFNRNFIDLNISNSGIGHIPFMEEFNENYFSCFSNLNRPVSIPGTNITTSRTYIGVQISNTTSPFEIGHLATIVNVFQEIHNGIVASNSNIDVENCRFVDMIQILENTTPHGGFGINLMNADLTINGLGYGANSTRTFKNCDLSSISANGSSYIEIRNCNFEFSKSTQTQIYHKEIQIQNMKPNSTLLIIDNYVYIGTITNQPIAGNRNNIIGISSSNFLSANITNNYLQINCNENATCKNFSDGIYITKSKNSQIFLINDNSLIRGDVNNNYVNGYPINARYGPLLTIDNSKNFFIENNNSIYTQLFPRESCNPAIFLSSADNVIMSNNFIIYKPTTNIGDVGNARTGIRILGSKTDSICTNHIFEARPGIEVEGASTNLSIGTTEFNKCYQGLHYVTGTVTMHLNDHKGNYWANTPQNAIEAQHDGGTYRLNQYYSKRNNYNQSNYKYWPYPPNPNNDLWFVPRDNHPEEHLSLECQALPFHHLNQFNPLIDTTGVLNELSSSFIWGLNKEFYSYVLNNNLEDSLGVFQNLFDSISTTNIPNFVYTTKAIDSIYYLNDNQIDTINALNNSLNQLNLSIIEVDSLLSISSEEWDTLLFVRRDSIIDEYKFYYDSLQNFNSALNELFRARISNAKTLVDSLDASEEFELEEKFVRQIEIKHILQDTLTADEIENLFSIATQCINDHGNIVLEAQSYLPDTLQFYREPRMFCAEELTVKNTNVNKKKINYFSLIKPVPAKEYVSIDFEIDLLEKIELYDINGVLLKSYNLNEISNQKISIEDLFNGIYLLKLITNKGQVITNRIIKI